MPARSEQGIEPSHPGRHKESAENPPRPACDQPAVLIPSLIFHPALADMLDKFSDINLWRPKGSGADLFHSINPKNNHWQRSVLPCDPQWIGPSHANPAPREKH